MLFFFQSYGHIAILAKIACLPFHLRFKGEFRQSVLKTITFLTLDSGVGFKTALSRSSELDYSQ